MAIAAGGTSRGRSSPQSGSPAPAGDDAPDGFAPIVHGAPFGALIGPIYERTHDDGFVRAIRVSEKHTGASGRAHGGLLMSFADIVLARAVHGSTGRPMVTVRLVTEFIAPVSLGAWLEGTAWVTRQGRSLVFVAGEFTVGRRTVATASATFNLRRARPR